MARLDNDQFNADQLIVLKVSAEGIPYSNPSATFDRAVGEIEVGNIHYRYVRKRLYNDSVEFLCIPDRGNSRLRSVKNDLLRLVTDLPDNGSHGRSPSRGKTAQLLLLAFWQENPAFRIGQLSALSARSGFDGNATVCPGHTRIGRQPPRPAAV